MKKANLFKIVKFVFENIKRKICRFNYSHIVQRDQLHLLM